MPFRVPLPWLSLHLSLLCTLLRHLRDGPARMDRPLQSTANGRETLSLLWRDARCNDQGAIALNGNSTLGPHHSASVQGSQ
ncbi:hypothetical protein F5Y09DRAFT_169918 [Xylaria sp. FL1042]|nr:hypothetical protein F5Y09DRAFT_169918 [Xylaria sp. FL1042]